MAKFELKTFDNVLTADEAKAEMINYIKNFTIEDEATYADVKNSLVFIKAEEKRLLEPFIEEKAKAYEPYKLAQTREKVAKDLFKTIRDEVSNILTPFTKKLDEQKAIEYAAKVEAAKKDYVENGVKPPVIEKKANTDGLRRTKTYEVNIVNINAIPREYLNITVNETKIKQAHKEGIQVPGTWVEVKEKLI